MMKDLVNLSIGFDEGTLTRKELLDYAGLIIQQKLYMTWPGRIGRFANDMLQEGFVDEQGNITPEGQEWIDEDE